MRLPLMVAGWILLSGVSLPQESPAQASGTSQEDVEAVYLYNFAKFVRWPASTEHRTVTICVAGQTSYVDTLKKVVTGEQLGGRPFEVRAVQSSGQEAGCDILFIKGAARDRVDELLAACAGKPALTVSDLPDFLDRGGMIQFVLAEDRVRFSVNLHPVSRSGISVSSELLKVAATVMGTPGGGGDTP